MMEIEIKLKGYQVEQRIGEELAKGQSFKADEDICILFLPREYGGKNFVCILTDEG